MFRAIFFACIVAAMMAMPVRAAEDFAPAEFPHFQFKGHDEEAQLLSDYLWYHFSKRLGNGICLFNREYLLCADTWMGGAIAPDRKKPIQEVHREDLLGIEIDSEGYVNTHQHFSHAHDHGWPFPIWTQAGNVQKAAGWHFQPLDKVPGWVGDGLRHRKMTAFCGEDAINRWSLENARSLGMIDNCWRIEASGPSPTIITPEGTIIDAFNAPFLQLRWKRSVPPKTHALPYVEWLREEDTAFGPDRRMNFGFDTTHLSGPNLYHSHMAMYRHPLWQGKIKRMRIVLAPGESDGTFDIDSFFTAYDTRHTINNPIFVLASRLYFNWTGDIDFLRQSINRMRTALRYQQTEMGGIEHNFIRNPWVGHDGLPGVITKPDGRKTIESGRGIGNNYWDIMPFGGDDFYATNQYYAATLALAGIEDAIRRNPGWGVPLGALAMDPAWLRQHAQAMKEEANRRFWNPTAGRFVAAIDTAGKAHDYGFTFLNLDSIWYGMASEEHARSIIDWINGTRIVEGDTSTGADIYHWRFGPRATTLRNIDWYGQGWSHPEKIPFGGQVQDGGAVLGFTFYDLWARLQFLGADNAWQRLKEILAWEKEVKSAGGYRAYYADGKQGTTMQGGGTAGGIGIDAEFLESSLLPSIMVYGFIGIKPNAEMLSITPKLPRECPELGMTNLQYQNAVMDIFATEKTITVALKNTPLTPIALKLPDDWTQKKPRKQKPPFVLATPGNYIFKK